MKKITRIIAAASFVALAASCAKEMTPELPGVEDVTLTKCTLSVSIDPDVKLSLDGTKTSWDAGDELAVFQYGRYKASETKKSQYNRNATANKFTARTTGEDTFDGTIANFKLRDISGDAAPYNNETSQANTFYIYSPASAVNGYAMSTSVTTLEVPAVQSGNVSDFGKYAIFNGQIAEEGNINYDESTSTLQITGTTSLKCITPVLKFNVPESLGATKIEIYGRDTTGSVALAGQFKMRGSGSTSDFTAATIDSLLTISRGGDVISGDVYAILIPTKMTGTRALQNEASKLVFKVFNAQGGYALVNGSLKNETVFKNGVITSVGSLPASLDYKCVLSSELVLLANTTPTVTLRDTLAGSSFYYTSGIESCADPTTASRQFYAKDGFALNVSSRDYSVGVVKVLVHNATYGDKVISALVRNWGFNASSSIGLAFNGKDLDAGASRTVDDMTVTNKHTAALNFEKFQPDFIVASSNFYMSLPVKNSSNVSVLACVCSNSSSSVRPYKFYKASAAEAIAGAETVASGIVAATVSTPFTFNLGNMNSGENVAFWANGGTNIYNLVILETAATITNVPEAPDELKISVDFSSVGLPTGSSTALKGDYDFNCAGYPFGIYSHVTSDTDFVNYWYDTSNKRLTWKKQGNESEDLGGYIKIPAIGGYTLKQVLFGTTSNNKASQVLDGNFKTAKVLGSFKVPDQSGAKDIVIDVTDPGNLDCYYFRFSLSTSLYVSYFTVVYAKSQN